MCPRTVIIIGHLVFSLALSMRYRLGQDSESALTHLSCGFHPLPDAEVAHDPGNEQTQS